jgi:hypothetical protein
MLDLSVRQGFTIVPGAIDALKSLPDPSPLAPRSDGADPAQPRVILVATKGPRLAQAPASLHTAGLARSMQGRTRVAVSDHAALGCPVGAPAHVWWDSGFGAVSEVWYWATIGGQQGSTPGPPAPSCGYTTCRWYAYINGVKNRWYKSVSVFNPVYAFIESAGCYY